MGIFFIIVFFLVLFIILLLILIFYNFFLLLLRFFLRSIFFFFLLFLLLFLLLLFLFFLPRSIVLFAWIFQHPTTPMWKTFPSRNNLSAEEVVVNMLMNILWSFKMTIIPPC